MIRVLVALGLFTLAACNDANSGLIHADPPVKPPAVQFHRLTPDLLVGPRPSPEQVLELSALGIQKVISVDALPPESSVWGDSLQLRHLPLDYRDIPRTFQLQLARELSADPVKTYIHCHHGQHRGPAAALTALLNLGTIDQVEASAWLDRCGVAYRGLRNAVQNAEPANPEDIQSATPLLEVAETKSLSRLMAEIDQVWDRLKRVPSPEAPNARTQAEDASELVDLLRLSSGTAGPVDPDYHQQMRKAIDLAITLESQILDGQDAAEARSKLRASCRACHRAYRD